MLLQMSCGKIRYIEGNNGIRVRCNRSDDDVTILRIHRLENVRYRQFSSNRSVRKCGVHCSNNATYPVLRIDIG